MSDLNIDVNDEVNGKDVMNPADALVLKITLTAKNNIILKSNIDKLMQNIVDAVQSKGWKLK